MSEGHFYYLNVGSNIEPEIHLPQVVERIKQYGSWKAHSSAWESGAVGSSGPSFLNACLYLEFGLLPAELQEKVIQPIESALGRLRSPDANAPRTIDIDMTMCDEVPLQLEHWNYAFVVVPMAELAPTLIHPILHEPLIQVAERMRAETRIIKRTEVLKASWNNG